MEARAVCEMTRPETSSIPLTVHTMRKMLMSMVIVEGKLDSAQEGELNLLLGEAITNAFVHASEGGKIIIEPIVSEQKVDLKITNQCDGTACDPCSSPDPEDLEESGRGCKIIEGLVNDLRERGLSVDASYENLPSEGESGGETVFSFSLSL